MVTSHTREHKGVIRTMGDSMVHSGKAKEGPPGVREVRELSSEGLSIEMGSEKKSKT